ncbi:MAG: hypothetical protein AAFQ13_06080 [Pseudomonadota bacterium]
MELRNSEKRILELFDTGRRPKEIHQITGLSQRYCREVCERYNDSPDPDRLREEKVRAGTRALLRTLTAVGRHQSVPEMKGRR